MPRRGWEIPEHQATPEDVYLNRRKFLRTMGGVSAAGLLIGCGSESIFKPADGTEEPPKGPPDGPPDPGPNLEQPDQNINFDEPLYPAPTNPDFSTLDRPLTDQAQAAKWNNFYEFSLSKSVTELTDKFIPYPWTVEIAGLVNQPKVYDLDHLVRLIPLEERLYRFRCVEAWAMAVPWTGPVSR
jgi:sulfoxide reductase catalytic subunit YedY